MRSRLSDRSRQRLRTITIILATALVIAPAAALAGHQFTDVPASNIFHADIDWMSDNDVTKGCNPPANTKYCPKDNVTREQMAAFMHRLETEGVFEQFGGTIPSGTTLTGNWSAAPSNGSEATSRGFFEMTFPTTASAPADISAADSQMGAGTTNGVDNDPQCTGTATSPTAPAGKVCWYVGSQDGLTGVIAEASGGDPARGARVVVFGDGTSSTQFALGSWAYTAP